MSTWELQTKIAIKGNGPCEVKWRPNWALKEPKQSRDNKRALSEIQDNWISKTQIKCGAIVSETKQYPLIPTEHFVQIYLNFYVLYILTSTDGTGNQRPNMHLQAQVLHRGCAFLDFALFFFRSSSILLFSFSHLDVFFFAFPPSASFAPLFLPLSQCLFQIYRDQIAKARK